jgi:glycosyltransferase involved in cell wall biosynthesis
MKFLFVDASHNGWGTERHLVSLAVGLRDAGHQVGAIVQRESITQALLQECAVQVIPTRIRGGADPRLLPALARAVTDLGPDWIVANQSRLYWSLLLFARITGTQVAFFRHLRSIRSWGTRMILPRLVDRFFVVSEFARQDLIRQGASGKHLLRLYNPIDVERLRPDPQERQRARSLFGIGSEELLAGFVGRLSTSKGVGVLSDALSEVMNRVPHLRMLWVGEGKQFSELVYWASTRGCAHRHIFQGWRANIESCYAAMDFLVAPSVEVETFGRAAVEAQCSGVPVIASVAGGLQEAVLDGETGILIPTDDVAALSAAMCHLAASASLRAQLGAAARRFVLENFSSAKICREFVAWLSATDRTADAGSFIRADH